MPNIKQPAPGPYEIAIIIDEEGKARGRNGEQWILIRNADGAIASVYPGKDAEGTARLLASSFELLEALRSLDLTCFVDVLKPCWDGRPTDIAGLHWASEAPDSIPACPGCIARAAIAKAEGDK